MKKPNNRTGSFVPQALIPCFLIILSSLLFVLTAFRVPLNSDHANQILQGKDILSGNIFLKGWNLTGVSFYFSEIPFYTLGTALFGVDPAAYTAAASAMIICLFIVGFFLSFNRKTDDPMWKVLLFWVLCGVPTVERIGYLRGHCAIFIYLFLELHCLGKIFSTKVIHKRLWITLYLSLMVPGCLSDMTLFLVCVLPVMLFCAFNLLRNGNRLSRHTNLIILFGSPLAAGLGMIGDSLLMKLGHINKNAFLDTRKFLDIFTSGEKFKLLTKGVLINQGGSFQSSSIAEEIRSGIALCAILIGIVCLFRALKRYFLNEEFDTPAVLISLGLVLMTAVCFFTDIYTSEDSARYISFFPFASAALICRELEKQMFFINRRSRAAILILTALLIPSIRPSFHILETPQDRLAVFLEENGLEYGYSAFWNASHTTVASHETVKVRAVRVRAKVEGIPDSLNMQNWFCKDEWYFPESANFVVFDGKGYLDVREDYVEQLLGKPEQILDNGEYRVFVYERNIAPEITLEVVAR